MYALATKTGLVVAMLATSFVMAHENDPKGTVKRIPYDGPSWRSDLDRQANAGGLAGGFDASGVELLANITMGEIDSGQDGNDCWGYTSPSGREYAILGTTGGTSFIEVTNPGNPQIVGYINGPDSLWRDVKVFGSYCYAVSEGGDGIQIISMANIDNGSVTLSNTVTSGGTTASHNVALDPVSGILARCGGGSNGLRLYTLASNPTNPSYVGAWSDEYVHDAQIHTMTTGPWAGRVIAFCCGGLNGGQTNTGLDIIDVTNPSSPVRLGGVTYPGGSYCHQGWLSEDEQTFYINDELYSGQSSTFIVNVASLTSPSFVTRSTNGNSSICHNLYTKGDRLYAANYRSGLRIFDISNANAPSEVGYFDTYPGSDGASFNGAWSCYPYFESGTIIVSDIERGLFVLTDDATSVSFSIVGGMPNPVASSGENISVLMSASGATIDNSTAVAVFNDGSGSQQLSMQYSSGTYSVTLPMMDCPGALTLRFAVQSTEGELFQSAVYNAAIADGEEDVFYDNGQTDMGYAVSGSASDGQWDRGVPIDCDRGDPNTDGDGSGSCWLTDNSSASSCNSDVDGGATVLTSPVMDASGGEAYVSYDRWYDNSFGGDPGNDTFTVEISNGGAWTLLETVGPSDGESSGGWVNASYRVADYVTPTSNVRVRFTAEDTGDGSVIEAGVDGLSLTVVTCDDNNDVTGDVNGDGIVDGADLSQVLGYWGMCSDPGNCPADINDDGFVDGADLASVLGNWTS